MSNTIFESLEPLLDFPANASDETGAFYRGSLSQSDLRSADLSFANLRGVNLSGADLSGASLRGADLREANLTKTKLDGAKLQGANLSGAQLAMGSLIKADLTGAILVQSSLDAATLSQACLRGADLRGAYLVGVDFSDSRLYRSYYSSETCFQKGFDPGKAEMLTEVQLTFGQVLTQLNLLGQVATSYLGGVITARYWEAARPPVDELKLFRIKSDSAQIHFHGNAKSVLGFGELQNSQIWVNQFIQNCSQVVRFFPSFLEQERLNYTLSAL